MRLHKTIFRAALLTAGLALPLAAPAFANVVITIDQGSQRMLVTVDGATRYDWPVSTGRAGYNTPDGTFKPNRMEAMHYSNEYEDAPMPHSIFFDMNGHAIHGFSDTPHLGMAVSHGCVRLSPANAAVLFDIVKSEGMENTSVIVRGHIPARGPLIARGQGPQQAESGPGYGQPAYGAASPYGGQPAYDQNYGRRTYGEQAHGQQAYGQQGYGQQGYYGRPSQQQPGIPAAAGPGLRPAGLRAALWRPSILRRLFAVLIAPSENHNAVSRAQRSTKWCAADPGSSQPPSL